MQMSGTTKPTGMKKTKSEELFERYLRETAHDGWDDHQPDLGSAKNPDYKISKNGASAIVDVKEFADSKLHQRSQVGNKVFNASQDEMLGDVRDKIGKFAKQVKPFERSGLPLVLVLANPNNILVPLGEFEIRAAMYGMPMFGGEFDPEVGQVMNMRTIPGLNGKLTNHHQYISAIAVLGTYTHKQVANDVWLDANRNRLEAEFPEDFEGKVGAVFDGLRSVHAPDGDFVFARVFHTESDQAVPLPPELFDGPHDTHTYLSRTP